MSDQDQNRPRPVDRVREGSIEASIWQNQRENGPDYKVTMSRFYKDRDGNYLSTESLRTHDLLPAQHLLGRTHDRIRDLRQQDREKSSKRRETEQHRER